MTDYTIVIGNKNYSSWSLRAWLALKATGADFKEIIIPLYQEGSRQEVLRYNPTGLVPALLADGHLIWDSLAIIEYLAETFPQAKLWPEHPLARAHARSISAEIHSSFHALRAQCSMNMKKRERITPTAETSADIARIERIWAEARDFAAQGAREGNFLYGHFTAADAMYAPVVSRFTSYGITVSAESRRYMELIESLPAYGEWVQAAGKETWVV